MERKYIIAGIAAAIIVGLDFVLFKGSAVFYFVLGIAAVILALPWVLAIITENKKEQEVDEMFLEFARSLAESVNTGTPISKSIINMKKKNFGPLNPYLDKLANQISLGISVNKALHTFAEDTGSPVIARAVSLISEAERAGGEIDFILESVAKSIAVVEKLKRERQAAIANLVMQGYIIFFIFIGIMLVMEYKILPLTGGIGSFGSGLSGGFDAATSGASTTETAISAEELSRPFLYLLLTQGFFAGLTIGKLTEGKIKAGIKHSFILTIAAFMVSTGVRAFFG
jgi:archaellum biogenesis protein FlaJ (TadC family)